MQDPEIENLLRRYRPLPPGEHLSGAIANSPGHQIAKSRKTWPWAIAAAALLTITLGLHGAVVPAPDASLAAETRRVAAIVEELGGAPGSDVMAEWIAQRERRAEQDARAERWTAVEMVHQ